MFALTLASCCFCHRRLSTDDAPFSWHIKDKDKTRRLQARKTVPINADTTRPAAPGTGTSFLGQHPALVLQNSPSTTPVQQFAHGQDNRLKSECKQPQEQTNKPPSQCSSVVSSNAKTAKIGDVTGDGKAKVRSHRFFFETKTHAEVHDRLSILPHRFFSGLAPTTNTHSATHSKSWAARPRHLQPHSARPTRPLHPERQQCFQIGFRVGGS